jgi:hypothetical protein
MEALRADWTSMEMSPQLVILALHRGSITIVLVLSMMIAGPTTMSSAPRSESW